MRTETKEWSKPTSALLWLAALKSLVTLRVWWQSFRPGQKGSLDSADQLSTSTSQEASTLRIFLMENVLAALEIFSQRLDTKLTQMISMTQLSSKTPEPFVNITAELYEPEAVEISKPVLNDAGTLGCLVPESLDEEDKVAVRYALNNLDTDEALNDLESCFYNLVHLFRLLRGPKHDGQKVVVHLSDTGLNYMRYYHGVDVEDRFRDWPLEGELTQRGQAFDKNAAERNVEFCPYFDGNTQVSLALFCFEGEAFDALTTFESRDSDRNGMYVFHGLPEFAIFTPA